MLVDFAQTEVRTVIAIANPVAGVGVTFKANRRLRVWGVTFTLTSGEATPVSPLLKFYVSNADVTIEAPIHIQPGQIVSAGQQHRIAWGAESAASLVDTNGGTYAQGNAMADIVMEPEWCLTVTAPYMTALSTVAFVRLVVEDVDEYGEFDGGDDDDE